MQINFYTACVFKHVRMKEKLKASDSIIKDGLMLVVQEMAERLEKVEANGAMTFGEFQIGEVIYKVTVHIQAENK